MKTIFLPLILTPFFFVSCGTMSPVVVSHDISAAAGLVDDAIRLVKETSVSTKEPDTKRRLDKIDKKLTETSKKLDDVSKENVDLKGKLSYISEKYDSSIGLLWKWRIATFLAGGGFFVLGAVAGVVGWNVFKFGLRAGLATII